MDTPLVVIIIIVIGVAGLWFVFRGRESSAQTFDNVPDGKYWVKEVSEVGGEEDGKEIIVVGFEVIQGEEMGKVIPCVFRGPKVKRVLEIASGGYILRLSFEEDRKAGKFEEWGHLQSEIDTVGLDLPTVNEDEPISLVRVKDGQVSKVYDAQDTIYGS
jgi:hypothetical protein